MTPAWKVALATFVVLLVSVAVIGVAAGGVHQPHPREHGQEIGRAAAPAMIILTVAAYIIQKARIDSRNRRDARARKDAGPG